MAARLPLNIPFYQHFCIESALFFVPLWLPVATVPDTPKPEGAKPLASKSGGGVFWPTDGAQRIRRVFGS
jgi:hypothetical protein